MSVRCTISKGIGAISKDLLVSNDDAPRCNNDLPVLSGPRILFANCHLGRLDDVRRRFLPAGCRSATKLHVDHFLRRANPSILQGTRYRSRGGNQEIVVAQCVEFPVVCSGTGHSVRRSIQMCGSDRRGRQRCPPTTRGVMSLRSPASPRSNVLLFWARWWQSTP